jgi:predicted membrane-bound spermidine synthase
MNFRFRAVVGLISLTVIPLELAWTRIFSAEFFYTFAFLVLSLAVLGLGLGGLALRLFSGLNRDRALGVYLALAGLCALLGPLAVFKLNLDFSTLFSSFNMAAKLALTTVILMSTFFFAGMALALVFKRRHSDMPRLYMADLVGAGIGAVAALWAMNFWGTPVASVLIAVPILLASLLVSTGWRLAVPLAIGAFVFVLAPQAESYMEVERPERAPVIYKHWDAMSKIKVYDFDGIYRGINIDNIANSPVYQFDGNWDDVDPDEAEWGIDVSFLIGQFDSCVFLSLGAGGGSDVMQALVEGATEVHAVEVNPHINYMMVRGDPDGYLSLPPPDTDTVVSENDTAAADTSEQDSSEIVEDSTAQPDTTAATKTLAEYSGFLYRDPRVSVITEDARSYVRRFENKFDVIYSLSSNTWAALASGSFALAENYLFTTEAFMDYWTALSDSGFLMMEHQVYVPRLVSEVKDALALLDIPDPLSHFAVYDLPQMRRKIVLLSKRPLTEELRALALGELTPEKYEQIHLLYPPANDSVATGLINRIVTEGWHGLADSAPVDLSPVTDNRPFIAQMGLWRNLSEDKLERVIPYAEFYGFPLSAMIMMIILVIAVGLVVPLNLLPYLRRGDKLKAVPWLYFFTIGVAFMAVEIILIQKYSLLVGSSLYTIAIVLLALLLASGIGSRFAREIKDSTAFLFIIGWLLLDAFVFPQVTAQLGGWTLIPRLLAASVIIIPLGFFMGMPFPKGALRAGELIDWGFAVNGTASVVGSVAVLLVVFAWGFSVGLALAAAFYLLAWMLMRTREAW